MGISTGIFLVLVAAAFCLAARLTSKFQIIDKGPVGAKGVAAIFTFLSVALVLVIVLLTTGFGPYLYKIFFSCYVVAAVWKLGTCAWGESSAPRNVALAVCALAVGGSWMFYPNLATFDLAAVVLTIWLLAMLGNMSFARITTLSIAVVLYDAIHVFGTHLMQAAAH